MSRNVSLLKSAMNLILKKDIKRRSKLNGYGISDTWFSRKALPRAVIINNHWLNSIDLSINVSNESWILLFLLT